MFYCRSIDVYNLVIKVKARLSAMLTLGSIILSIFHIHKNLPLTLLVLACIQIVSINTVADSRYSSQFKSQDAI